MGYYSMNDDAFTLILNPYSIEADVETRWHVYISYYGISHEEWPVKVVKLYDHVSDDCKEYSVDGILRKVWIQEGEKGGARKLFPELFETVDGGLITYDFREVESCIDSVVERYNKWEIYHAATSAKLPF